MAVGWSGPDPSGQDDGLTNYELGTRYLANGDITVNKFRVWHPATSEAVVGRKGRLWTNLGSLIADALLVDSLPSGWSTYALAAPEEILSGTQFVVSYTTRRYYGFTSGGYPRASADTLLTAQSGLFLETAAGLFPTNATGSFYGIDVEYVAGIGGNVAPAVGGLKVSSSGMNATATWTINDELPGLMNYRVEWGDGSFTNTTTLAATHTYTTTGTYAVMVTATDSGGLQDSAATFVRITGLAAAELRLNRRNTLAYIMAKPMTLALKPTLRVKTASGGIALPETPSRVAQTFRLIEQASAYGNAPGLLQAGDGKQRRITYQLLGEWDCELAVGDHWVDANGIRYEVMELLPDNYYERRGRVVQYGEA